MNAMRFARLELKNWRNFSSVDVAFPRPWVIAIGVLACGVASLAAQEKEPLFLQPVDVRTPHVSTDDSIKYDYDIVYVRAGRAGDEVHKRYYTDFSSPVTIEPGADLMLLHPDGRDELLVEGGEGSITDPVVSFDAQWVYFVRIYNLKNHSQWNPPRQGADIFKIHLATRNVVRLTNRRFTPNTGAADWSRDFRSPEAGKSHLEYGVFNTGPCPLPGGRLAFTSNRDGFRPAKGYPAVALQLFVMDDRDEDLGDDETPRNLDKIGHFNLSGALHPVALQDGRLMFSSLESQGIRSDILWGVWTIHPDGTNWAPLVSAFDPGGAPNGFHFQTQLSDGAVVVEEYYNQNNSGFGAYIKLPAAPPDGYPAFGPGYMGDARNKPWRYGRHDNGKGVWYRMPFMPTGSESLTPFTHGTEGPAGTAVYNDKTSPKVGKFTHPSAAPDKHLLTIYSPGPVNHQYKYLPQVDGGIYLLTNGDIVESPSQLRLIKNDPRYNEQWPRAVVPYQRIYGQPEPRRIAPLANDGTLSKHLPAGAPYGLVGTSSLYKRESYPNGVVKQGSVTATYAGGNDPWKGLDAFTSHGNGMPLNWHNQGADVGLYSNDDIHAVRILAMEPTTDRQRGAHSGRRFHNHARERLRILGELPVRKFTGTEQPLDPDGNPDTSFLARIPADTAFTFQTLDKDGMVLNMSQTWHQLRPGEIRTNCGGCHAHSQPPTPFEKTAAARADYDVWDLVTSTPLLVDKRDDKSQRRWDREDSVGLNLATNHPENVEYSRDVLPIIRKSCVACHSARDGREPAAKLALDADGERVRVENLGELPGTYVRLALDERAKFGHKPVGYDSWGYPQASRYVRMFQSRRSLLAWKIYGRRLDGFSNDDHPSESEPGRGDLALRGQPVDVQKYRSRWDVDFVGSSMPPAAAVTGDYVGPNGQKVKVEPLSDRDRRTITRWIDLGCPIDLDDDPARSGKPGQGWYCDDNRPIVTVNSPRPGRSDSLAKFVIGMHDYYTGIEFDSFSVVASFDVNGMVAGKNLANQFRQTSRGVWELELRKPAEALGAGRLTVSVRDAQGNVTRVERTFEIGAP